MTIEYRWGDSRPYREEGLALEKSSGSGCAFSLTSTETLSRGGKR